jgi:Spermine/spermidine synthase domain
VTSARESASRDTTATGLTEADGRPVAESAEPATSRHEQLRLGFASFLMLFVELALIRWVTSNNVYVTKATNFVLIASFLGIGIGFLNVRSNRNYLRWTPVALLATVAFVLGFPVILATLNTGSNPYQGLGGMPALPQPLSLAVIFLVVTATMAGLGQGVARIFVGLKPLSAYRMDIAGSIAGILVFSLLSFLNQPPATWGFIACGGLMLMLAPRIRWWQAGAALAIVTLLSLESFIPNQIWSPYNKLSIQHSTTGRAPGLYLSANNIPYQAAHTLPILQKYKPFYFYPYQHIAKSQLKNVLIIGAGSGNDTAVALHEGAQHIDAVDIDPQLLGLGRDQNPAQPYQSKRVTVYSDDGRAFLQDTSKKYNLILFALPDSLEAVSGQSAVRLESFVLTLQSLQTVKKHLLPGGTFSMYNYYAPFLLSRYATTIHDAFNRNPCQNLGPPLGGRRMAVLTVDLGGPVQNCASYWHGSRVDPVIDDRPFPYLPTPSIPISYLWMLGAILLGSAVLIRIGGSRGTYSGMRRYIDLAFMGAAFMLLETKNIVQFALLFGTTWLVNSLVFAGVLIAVYLAVETARHIRLPRPMVLYALLLVALVVAWLVPLDAALSLPVIPRFLAGTALAFAPVYLANLVFAQRFADVEMSGTAFAANLLGTIVGAALEYIALITGYQFLLILVGVLYALAFLTRPRARAYRPAG